MIGRISASVQRQPWFHIAWFSAAFLLFTLFIAVFESDISDETLLPTDYGPIQNMRHSEKLFGGNDFIMLLVSDENVLGRETLQRVRKISSEMERAKEFDKVVSLYSLKKIRNENGRLLVEDVLGEIVSYDEARENILKYLEERDYAHESVLSKDLKHTAIIGYIKISTPDEAVLSRINRIISDNPGPEEITVAGFPQLRSGISRDMLKESLFFLPICAFIMLIVLLIAFRQLHGVILPVLLSIMTISAVWGLLHLLGLKINILTLTVPALLLAVGSNIGVHFSARYQNENLPGSGLSNKELCALSLTAIGSPSLASAATAIICFICMSFNLVLPSWQPGIAAAAAAAFALLGGLFFVPSWFSILPRPRPYNENTENAESSFPALDTLLIRAAAAAKRHPLKIIAAFTAVAALSAYGLMLIEIDANPQNYYAEDAPISIANEMINSNFDGLSAFSVVARGDIKDPSLMKHIDDLEKELGNLPNVGNTLSVAQFVRKMNVIMHGGDEDNNRIPDDRERISSYFMQYSVSGDARDFDRLVDYSYRHAQITAILNEHSMSSMKELIRHVRKYNNERNDSPFVIVGGLADLFTDLADNLFDGQSKNIVTALLLAGIIAVLLLRSILAALLTMLVPSFALITAFGTMGHLNIQPGIPSVLLSFVPLVIGMDFAVHIMWGYRNERCVGSENVDAVKSAVIENGRGILFCGLALMIGFSSLLFSDFTPIRQIGFLVVFSASASLIATILLIPALCLLVKPTFSEKTD